MYFGYPHPQFIMIELVGGSLVLSMRSLITISWSLPFPSNPLTMLISKIERTFLILSKFLNIAHWNLSLVHFTPRGNLLKWYHPNSVMKAGTSFDCCSSFICQYLDFISTVVNHLSPSSLKTISSNMAVTKWSLCTVLFKSFGSRYNLTYPFVLETYE